jgi:hypothetical protein
MNRRLIALRAPASLLLALAALALSSTACVHVRPWERGKLAHHTMVSEVTGPAEEHLHAVQEGAQGGGSSAESGCGCN